MHWPFNNWDSAQEVRKKNLNTQKWPHLKKDICLNFSLQTISQNNNKKQTQNMNFPFGKTQNNNWSLAKKEKHEKMGKSKYKKQKNCKATKKNMKTGKKNCRIFWNVEKLYSSLNMKIQTAEKKAIKEHYVINLSSINIKWNRDTEPQKTI